MEDRMNDRVLGEAMEDLHGYDPNGDGPDWRSLEEDVTLHTMMRIQMHLDDGRTCGFHSRLGKWTFDGVKECLRSHDRPTKTRPGDQVLPTGDESLVDDQALLIQDIEARRQVGIERYGQGHRPFNGRNTLEDMYEEQLDLLVYLRSIKRMSEATREELIKVVSDVLITNGFQRVVCDAMAEVVVDRIMGWVSAEIIKAGER